ILIELVQKTTIQLLIPIKSLMIVTAVKYSPLWMVFPITIKSTFYLLINQKRLSFVHGGHLLIANYLLDSRMPGNFSKGHVLCVS
ncbi:hypothetical protein OYG11_12300, partial [Actinobacillus pleuropneumoniae]